MQSEFGDVRSPTPTDSGVVEVLKDGRNLLLDGARLQFAEGTELIVRL